MELAYINREISRWARERQGVSRTVLADQLGVTPQQITQWETGPQYPPFGRAQDLAKALEIPFGYLFLSGPPVDRPTIPDLRKIDPNHRPDSQGFIDLLNDILVKHDWYIGYAKEGGGNRLPFVGRYSLETPFSRVVADIRAVLELDGLRRRAKNWSDYLRLLAQRAEESGILVMRAGVVRGNSRRKLSVKEFRGFAISNPISPLVFINTRDALAAQIFTLAHELVHIWIGQSGISNLDLANKKEPRVPAELIEQYCNDVAAELLVPAAEFDVLWGNSTGDNGDKAEYLARRFWVSVPVILRRANERGHIAQSVFFRLWQEHQDKMRALEQRHDEEKSSGGNFYNTFIARNSHKLTQAVVSVVRDGGMGTLEAARLLSVRTATIPKLAERFLI
jgi:Zn-dependent peptidase ImmA (M78 family)/transcriptional regulator with XRE-family HTH domain